MKSYSIDEAFLELEGDRESLLKQAETIRNRIADWVGIPVSVGIAPTKTLAKIAGHLAKSSEANICVPEEEEWPQLLESTEIRNIWGIGRQYARHAGRPGHPQRGGADKTGRKLGQKEDDPGGTENSLGTQGQTLLLPGRKPLRQTGDYELPQLLLPRNRKAGHPGSGRGLCLEGRGKAPGPGIGLPGDPQLHHTQTLFGNRTVSTPAVRQRNSPFPWTTPPP